MRFILILLVALSLTLAWQSSVIAGVYADQQHISAEAKKDGEKKKEADEEPECD